MLSEGEVLAIRSDYPILNQRIGKHELVYLDNAATTQIPECVLDTIISHYHADNANVHRGVHTLSNRSTESMENARDIVAKFINAPDSSQVIFTSGATASINLVARGMEHRINPGCAIVVSGLEHHSNFVPWQQMCLRRKAVFIVAPLDKNGNVDQGELSRIFEQNNVAILAVAHVSNVLGTVSPIRELTKLAHVHGAEILVDAAQSIRHEAVDVQEIDCDYLVFSGHKMMAPTGIGVLYGKKDALESLDPPSFGGEMVDVVTRDKTTFEHLPIRLEPGTPNYVGAIALGAACSYLSQVGRNEISEYEHYLTRYAEEMLDQVSGVDVLGRPEKRAGCVSFTVDNAHPFDIAKLLDAQGIAVRSGTQCAQPLLRDFADVRYVARLSPAFYNTPQEIEVFIRALRKTLLALLGD